LTSGIFGIGVVTVGASTTDKSQIYMASGGTFKNAIVVNSAQGTDASEFGAFRIAASNPFISGSINANLADATFNSINAGQAASVTGAISGNSGVVIMTQSAGVLNITLNATSGANTYAGNTTISTANATLTLGKADQISNGAGKGNLIITSGTFKMGGFSETINGLSGNGTVDGVSGTPTLTVGDNDATSTFSGVIKNTAGNLSLTKTGNGTLTLSGSNTYTGGTTLNTGTLVIGNTAAAGTGTITQSSGSSLLKFDTTGTVSNAMSIYNVASNQTMTLSGSITAQNTTYDVASGTTLSINGTISGSGGVTKNGTGTLSISGNNTFTGNTTVNSGTLRAGAANALGDSLEVVVNSGGSLLIAASEAIDNAAAVKLNGGTIEFDGNVTETLGAFTLLANSTIDMAGGNIWLQFSGLSAQMQYDLKIYNYTLYSDYLYFVNTTDVTASLSRIKFYSDSGSSLIGSSFIENSFGPSPYHVRPVPEPETYATAALLLLGLGIYAYRRRQAAKPELN
jgi:autotransporter-associated beta strand protein